MSPIRDALRCEHHPRARVRTASVIVMRGGTQTIASTSDWQLSAALAKAALR